MKKYLRNRLSVISMLMKYTTLIIALVCSLSGLLMANNTDAQALENTTVSLSVNGKSIGRVLTEIESKTAVSFVYDPADLKKDKIQHADFKNEKIKTILFQLGYNCSQKGAFLILTQYIKPPRPGRISGKVLDEKGGPLLGATIKVIENSNAVQAGTDGTYIFNLQPGTYTLEISYISFLTKRITGIIVKEDQNTPLDIALQPNSKGLNEVVITASYKKASVEGLLVRQKNASEISNGISAEQIARTPDKNIGESLKRISGVSTADNKFVLVRGIGERYNSAILDGVILPSTEAQSRNFSFDMIPSNLVDNVVVSKTVTPDMNVSFGGGLIQINTKDIPNENFMSFTAGTSYNDQSTGKDFLSHKRGKYDYLGFDDGRRNYPQGLENTARNVAPNTDLTDEQYQKKVIDQSKRFTVDNVTMYRYKTAPSQNYQFTIGRLMALDTLNNNKLGFTGSVSYRNTQSINVIDIQHRGDWFANTNNPGAAYDFNTTLGALFNIGLQLGQNRFSFRNTFTHVYDNTLARITGYDDVNGSGDTFNQLPPSRIQEADDPTYTDLFQNKISGKHTLGKVKIEWDAARTSINREEKDMVLAESYRSAVGDGYKYFYNATNSSEVTQLPLSRHNYKNNEKHYSWNVSATVPLNVAGIRNSLKTGYFGIIKRANFNWQIAALSADRRILPDSLNRIPVADMLNPQNFNPNGYFYSVSQYWLDGYEGKSFTNAGFLMFDTRIAEKWRLVWGLRAEHYKYTEIRNDNNIKGTSEFKLPHDKAWQLLPSANLTYSPNNKINIRAAYSSSVVRPELMENSQFWRYSPYLGAQFGNFGISSTRINSYDIKTELFPGLGEIISAGAFYKKFDNPAELTYGNLVYVLRSANWAKVYGLEFEARKSLGFITPSKLLSNLTVYGNLSLQKSEVLGTFKIADPTGGPDLTVTSKQKRSMYGQSPYLYNVGVQYSGDRFGFNLMLNGAGFKTYLVAAKADEIEYERPRQQLDAQVSYKMLKKRLEIKLNAGNLLNKASTFYRNTASYEPNPGFDASVPDISNQLRLKPGFSNEYEVGDMVRFSQKFGRTYSTSISYNF